MLQVQLPLSSLSLSLCTLSPTNHHSPFPPLFVCYSSTWRCWMASLLQMRSAKTLLALSKARRFTSECKRSGFSLLVASPVLWLSKCKQLSLSLSYLSVLPLSLSLCLSVSFASSFVSPSCSQSFILPSLSCVDVCVRTHSLAEPLTSMVSLVSLSFLCCPLLLPLSSPRCHYLPPFPPFSFFRNRLTPPLTISDLKLGVSLGR